MSSRRELAMIAAVGRDLELGRNGDLVWHISADLKNFKRLTLGHPVIMGRKTWDSLPKRPLPGRLNVVLSRNMKPVEGAVVAASVEEALQACEGADMPFVMGGAEIYARMLPMASRLYITDVDADAPADVDAWFPEFRKEWRLDEAGEWLDDGNGVKYRFETWLKRDSD
ncbi:MAG: dihydrofolate reductase [Muribaculaceae bacterium]|nr:dihydrofolate reductase [Muribaculaceae bacterium]